MLTHLRKSHPAMCRQWFEELEPLSVASGQFNLRTQSTIHREYLRRSCADAFNDAARTVSGRLLSVRFLGPDEDWSLAPDSGPASAGVTTSDSMPLEDDSDAAIDPYALGPAPAASRPDAASGPATLSEAPGAEPVPAHAEPAPTRPESGNAIREPKPSRPSRVVIEQGSRRDDALVINPDYSFENFVVGPGNRLAHAAAQAIGDNTAGRNYNPLFIHGGVGLGKTHLLQAACLRILERNPATRVYYVSCEGFMTQFIESVQSGQMSEFRHRYRDVDILVVDDIHFLAHRDRTQEEFFHTFNTLFQAGKRIFLSSDAPPEEIPDLEERLVSRFKWGLVAKIEPPCYETRVAILKTKAKVRGLELPEDCACLIAARVATNIRELEGAITRLQILSTVENRPIDLAMTRATLGEASEPAAPAPSLQDIITAVTDFYHVRLTDMQSKKRPRSVTMPRQVCMFLARRMTRLSLEEIGGYFGGRDHTTVMHAVKAIDQRRKSEPDFAETLASIEDRVRTGRPF